MALTTAQKNKLNKMNEAARQTSLGTLLGNLEDGVLGATTPGTVEASKTVVAGASREIATIGAITSDGVFSTAKTYTAASGQATERLIRSEVTLTPATTMTLGSNSIAGVRGCITLSSGKELTDGFLYGVQGKLVLAGTVSIGSGMAYALMGQLDVSGSTITDGYVAGVGSDIFGVSSGTKAVDMFYGQHADGGTIHSYLRAYGKSEYVFHFDSNSGASIVIGAGTYSTADGYLLVKVNDVDYRIPLFSAVD